MWYYWNIEKPLRHFRMLIEEKLGLTIVFRDNTCIICQKRFENGYQCHSHMVNKHRLSNRVTNNIPSEADHWIYSTFHEWNMNKYKLPNYMLSRVYNN